MSGFFVPHDIRSPLRGAPAGPLAGLTAVVKDMYAIAGERTSGGNPDWLAAATPATENAAAIDRILKAGATIVGKAICDEFFYSVAGINAHYGTPANLRAPGRIPGGSSSGSAAATAAGACDFALGSDTGGSVRIPASFCGLYGIRTTHGRVDVRGCMDMSPSFDTIGWFANGPGVFRNVGRVLLGGKTVAATVDTVLLADDCFEETEPGVAPLLRRSLDRMGDVLPRPQPVRLAPDGLDRWREAVRLIQAHEIWQVYGRFVEQAKPKFGPGVAERMAAAAKVTRAQADAAKEVQAAARERLRALIRPGTVVALPTAPSIAPLIDTPPAALDAHRLQVMRLTCAAGLGGLPQVSVPAGTLGGCPVGLSFIAWPGGDEALLDLAAAVSPQCGTCA